MFGWFFATGRGLSWGSSGGKLPTAWKLSRWCSLVIEGDMAAVLSVYGGTSTKATGEGGVTAVISLCGGSSTEAAAAWTPAARSE